MRDMDENGNFVRLTNEMLTEDQRGSLGRALGIDRLIIDTLSETPKKEPEVAA